jgi:hypothetical protein
MLGKLEIQPPHGGLMTIMKVSCAALDKNKLSLARVDSAPAL